MNFLRVSQILAAGLVLEAVGVGPGFNFFHLRRDQ